MPPYTRPQGAAPTIDHNLNSKVYNTYIVKSTKPGHMPP